MDVWIFFCRTLFFCFFSPTTAYVYTTQSALLGLETHCGLDENIIEMTVHLTETAVCPLQVCICDEFGVSDPSQHWIILSLCFNGLSPSYCLVFTEFGMLLVCILV